MDTRQRIIEATTKLLEQSSVAAVSTRDICKAAGVTSPTLYHHFGDKDGLLDAVVAAGFESYVAAKRSLERTDDVIADLYRAWDAHVEFGVAHPSLYALMYGSPRAGSMSPAANEAQVLLHDLLERVAAAGLLRLDVQSAVPMVGAVCVGATLQAIHDGGDMTTSDRLRDTVLGSIVVSRAESDRAASVADLARSMLVRLDADPPSSLPLRPSEVALFQEWLGLLAAAPPT